MVYSPAGVSGVTYPVPSKGLVVLLIYLDVRFVRPGLYRDAAAVAIAFEGAVVAAQLATVVPHSGDGVANSFREYFSHF